MSNMVTIGDISGDINRSIIAGGNVIIQAVRSYVEDLDQEIGLAQRQLAEAVTNKVSRYIHLVQKLSQEERHNPYKALLDYKIEDASFFFGRDNAIHEMLNHLQQSRLTILHAASGSGKSSLLQAGLASNLLSKGHLPIYVRPYNQSPAKAIKREFLPDIDNLPELERFKAMSLKGFLAQVSQQLPERTVYIFLDQFEEFFEELKPEQQSGFAEELAACLNEPGMDVRWVLALRKEYFSNLNVFRPHISNPFENDYFLPNFHLQEATKVIVEPIQQKGFDYESGLVNKILNDISPNGSDLAPPQVQLICYTLFDELTQQSNSNLITHELYHQERGHGGSGARGILSGHLNKVLSRMKVEERAVARSILEALVTSRVRRAVKTKEVLLNEFRNRQDKTNVQLIENVLDNLVDSRLLRTDEAESQKPRYELAHDYLLAAIELDPETQALKAAQELLNQEVAAWNDNKNFRIPSDRLNIIVTQQAHLNLDDSARKLLALSKSARRRSMIFQFSVVIVMIILAILALAINQIRGNQLREQEIAITQTAIVQQAAATAAIIQQAAVAAATIEIRATAEAVARREAVAAQETAQARQVLAENAQKEAERQSKISLSRQLAAQSVSAVELQQDIELSLLLAVEAARASYAAGEQDVLQILTALRRAILPSPIKIFRYEGEQLVKGELLEANPLDLIKVDRAIGLGQIIGNKDVAFQYLSKDEASGTDFSRDGRRLAVIYSDNTVRLIDVRSGTQINTLYHSADLVAVRFSPDGTRIATTTRNNTVHLWNVFNSEELVQIYHLDRIRDIDFSPDSTRLATASEDGTARLIDSTNGKEIATITYDEDVWDIDFSPDSTRLATASEDGTARLIDSTNGKEIFTLQHRGAINDIDFSPDGSILATASHDHTACIWSSIDGKKLFTFDHPFGWVWDLAFSPDSNRLATAAVGFGEVFIWDTRNGKELVKLPHSASVRSVVFSPNGSRLATYTDADTAYIWDSIKGIELAKSEHRAWIKGITFSPDDHYWVSLGDDRVAYIWDSKTGEELASLPHRVSVSSAAFSPDSDFLATFSESDSTRLYSKLDTQEPFIVNYPSDRGWWDSISVLDNMDVHLSTGFSIWSSLDNAQSPDRNQLAVTNEDGAISTVRIIDTSNDTHSKEIATLLFKKSIRALAFTQDGSYLITVSDADHSFQLWQPLWWAKTKDLVTQACDILSRNFTKKEWQTYIGDSENYRSTCGDLSWIQ